MIHKCIDCGYDFDGNFCPQCGTKFEGQCPNCGARRKGDGDFCSECGYSFALNQRRESTAGGMHTATSATGKGTDMSEIPAMGNALKQKYRRFLAVSAALYLVHLIMCFLVLAPCRADVSNYIFQFAVWWELPLIYVNAMAFLTALGFIINAIMTMVNPEQYSFQCIEITFDGDRVTNVLLDRTRCKDAVDRQKEIKCIDFSGNETAFLEFLPKSLCAEIKYNDGSYQKTFLCGKSGLAVSADGKDTYQVAWKDDYGTYEGKLNVGTHYEGVLYSNAPSHSEDTEASTFVIDCVDGEIKLAISLRSPLTSIDRLGDIAWEKIKDRIQSVELIGSASVDEAVFEDCAILSEVKYSD